MLMGSDVMPNPELLHCCSMACWLVHSSCISSVTDGLVLGVDPTVAPARCCMPPVRGCQAAQQRLIAVGQYSCDEALAAVQHQ